jgi:DNA polymerase IIIc chi subunit
LWTFKDTSFVPHSQDQKDTVLPVLVGHTAPSSEWNELLVNLTQDIPAFFKQFQRVAEIAPDDTSWRSRARKHYKNYREQGCELESHQL